MHCKLPCNLGVRNTCNLSHATRAHKALAMAVAGQDRSGSLTCTAPQKRVLRGPHHRLQLQVGQPAVWVQARERLAQSQSQPQCIRKPAAVSGAAAASERIHAEARGRVRRGHHDRARARGRHLLWPATGAPMCPRIACIATMMIWRLACILYAHMSWQQLHRLYGLRSCLAQTTLCCQWRRTHRLQVHHLPVTLPTPLCSQHCVRRQWTVERMHFLWRACPGHSCEAQKAVMHEGP